MGKCYSPNDFIHDAQKALNVLIQQPEVDPKRISILGRSEGTQYAPSSNR